MLTRALARLSKATSHTKVNKLIHYYYLSCLMARNSVRACIWKSIQNNTYLPTTSTEFDDFRHYAQNQCCDTETENDETDHLIFLVDDCLAATRDVLRTNKLKSSLCRPIYTFRRNVTYCRCVEKNKVRNLNWPTLTKMPLTHKIIRMQWEASFFFTFYSYIYICT